MKPILRYFLFAAIILVILSCKEDPIVKPPVDNKPKVQYGTPFANVPNTEDIVMYEINLRAFSPEGDIQGVINRLDDLNELGVNVIWLMPIHPIGEINSVNSPYSVKDYKDIGDEYGSMGDLRKLTDEAHKKDMAVIMDWVANHTSWDNSWISNKDWYTQDASGNIISPAGTGWLDVADLDYENTEMQDAMISAMKYWAWEANIDGYRCDYADGVPLEFWKRAIDTLKSIPNRKYVFLAEGSRRNHFEAGFDILFGWDFYGKMISIFGGSPASGAYATHITEYSNVPAGKHILRYSTNHDESAWNDTPMVLFKGADGAIAASVATIFMGGVPLIYTGQEVGTVGKVPFFTNSTINWDNNPGMMQSYQDILSFYNSSAAARQGTVSNYPDNDIICFSKTLNEEDLLILVNTRGNQLTFSLPAALQNTSWTNGLTNEAIQLTTSLDMAAYNFLILKK